MDKTRKVITYIVVLCLLVFLGTASVCGIVILLNACNDIKSELLESYENVRTVAAYSSIGGIASVFALCFCRKYMPYDD